MTVSNQQALQELLQIFHTSEHPALVRLRALVSELSAAQREEILQTVAQFMTSETAWDAAVKQLDSGPLP